MKTLHAGPSFEGFLQYLQGQSLGILLTVLAAVFMAWVLSNAFSSST